MKTNKEIVEHLNSLRITQTSSWDEDIPEDLYDEYFKNANVVESGLEVDKHRWYELSIEVLEMNEGFIGVLSVTDVVGENNSIEDMFHTLEFFEMEEIQITSYKIKK